MSRVRQLATRRTLWMSLGGIAILGPSLLFAMGGCSRNTATAQSESHPTLETETVVTVNPRLETIHRLIEQPGFVTSYEETPIYTKLAGYLENVWVDKGTKLKSGDKLCTIYVPEIKEKVEVRKSKIEQARADVSQSKALFEVAKAMVLTWEAKVDVAEKGLQRAKSTAERWKEEFEVDREALKNGKVLDQQTVDEAENQYKAAQARCKEAIANLQAARSSLIESHANRDKAQANVEVNDAKLVVCDKEYKEELAWWNYHEITAPYDGVVTQRNVHTWHFVQPSNSGSTSKNAEPLFMFMREDVMRVVIQVPEVDAPLVKDGADAIVKIPALRNREEKAKVTRSSWFLNQEARTLRVEIDLKNPLENPKEELLSGMYVNVRIATDLPNVMTVPLDAVQTEGSQDFIFVVQDGKAKRVNVKLGVSNDRVVRIIEKQVASSADDESSKWTPMTGQEKVIISHLDTIKDGVPVTVK